MESYHWLRLSCGDRTWHDAWQRTRPELEGRHKIWGAFHGLFGLGSNELIVVTYGEDPPPGDKLNAAGFEVTDARPLTPTVRPERFTPLTRPGLYVFRLFDVATVDVEEIARLSKEAWVGFENTDGYTTEPQGLFAPADRATPEGTMVLLTWYAGLESWQTSRGASPEATELFRQRRELTKRTIAYATRLMTENHER